ncbi:aminotransferase-like, mobile domain protein [Arabidopsis thaliana]|uniref:Aminotransferase-like, mobile domain protein n=1 Tax=Arabidopsis thaliana TaxID=3702 RepID=A0A1P8AQ63_ARATH|nr:aminotransferase-like, mobile domain protein [Arabidopsis thaliana]ANM58784.1 aminotransferase-like, mobile domain protein [Arabidopsis thaliana]|eukprot:NP_001321196.1 aminotransferase-like, mobile domain protein [Arabidopsis thaliana]
MASRTENSSSKRTHLSKPCLSSSIDGFEDCQNRSSALSVHLKALSTSIKFWGWRFPNKKFKSWARKMASLHEPIWRKAGIFEAVIASTYKIPKDTDLVLGLAEKWCPDTKTFIFPWGEATITLEDVMVLLGFSVLGLPVFATVDSSGKEIMAKLEKEWKKIKNDKVCLVTKLAWMERFMNSGDELEHVGFLVLWLSYFAFPSHLFHISEAILPVAVHLSSGTKMALAPAVLAHLYADLSLLQGHIRVFSESLIKVQLDLNALFKLVQVWAWERFRELQLKPFSLLRGEPRLARWCDMKQSTSNAWRIFNNSKMDSFEWRPYTKTVKNWDFPRFYPERAMRVPVGPNLDDEFISFARCIKVSELVGIDSVEHYFPNRVASQFGMRQDVHCPVNQKKLSRDAAWNDYDKPIDGLTIYIPSRSAISCVTPMCEPQRKGFVESDETLKSRTIIGDDTSFVTSGSKMNRTSEDEMKIAENSTNKRRKYMKQAHRGTMGLCQKQVPSDNDEDDDSLTVSQVTNSGGDCEPLGKKCRLEVGNNDSKPCHKPFSISYDGDETVPPPEVGQRNEETDETASKAGKRMVLRPLYETDSSGSPVDFDGAIDIVEPAPETRQLCDDELDAYGSYAEKSTKIDAGSKEPKCLLHEDDAIAGEMTRSDSKLCSETEKENDDGRINDKVQASKGDKDETSKTYKSMVLSSSDKSNIHITAGGRSQGQNYLLHDDGFGSEETKKSSEQLEDLEKRNHDFGDGEVDNDTTEKRFQELKVLESSIEERILKAERTVAWLKEKRAI